MQNTKKPKVPKAPFSTTKNPLTDELMPLDHTVQRTDHPLPLIRSHIIWTISGAKGSGKSTLLLNALKKRYKKHFDNIFLFSPTAKGDTKFKTLVKELEADGHYFDSIDSESMQAVIDSLWDYNNEFDAKEEGHQPCNLIIIDDSVADLPNSHTRNNAINKLFTMNRQIKCSVWVCTQKYNLLNTVIRANSDLISFFPTYSKPEYESLKKDLSCPDEVFDKCYDIACSKENGFLHINKFCRPVTFFSKFDKIEVPIEMFKLN